MTARERILHALQAAGTVGCTTGQLCQPDVGGVRFGARVLELREQGHKITATLVRPGQHRYVLHGSPVPSGPASQPPSAERSGADPDETGGALFELPRRGASMYDDLDGAA